MMKGMALPINMIVIVAIAVLVLVVVAAFFTGAFTNTGFGFEQAFQQGCQNLIQLHNCAESGLNSVNIQYQGPGEASPSSIPLAYLCAQKLGEVPNARTATNLLDVSGCLKACGCSGI